MLSPRLRLGLGHMAWREYHWEIRLHYMPYCAENPSGWWIIYALFVISQLRITKEFCVPHFWNCITCVLPQNFDMRYCNTSYVMTYGLLWLHKGYNGVSNHQPHDCLLNRLFGRRSKKTSKLCVTGLCAGNSPGTGELPAQRASNAENSSIWWSWSGSLTHDIVAR